ncbi:unnamed protein product [Rotaria sordida]|uniref:Arylesterase n=2 Tax=Rotaria sordida TaxID=392033 RepID=A0A813YPQ7_9BILA|nr:unnamed protein product [Rotaria sordida]CAF3653839.1 unnamed protein product [Rotaria sordida]
MLKSIVLLSCLVLILAFIGKYMIDFGVFRHIETKGLDKCRLIVAPDGDDLAFEDFAIDYQKGIAYMGGDDRRWFHTFNLLNQNIKKQGKFFSFDIESETFNQLNLINYPYEHLHPLGIDLLIGRKKQLFITNYRVDNEEIIGAVDIFEIDSSNENQLIWIDSVVHPLFTVPDDVLAIDDKTFYVTNIYRHRKDKSNLMHTIEVFSKRPWSNLLLCSKKNEWQCSIVVDSIALANGIGCSFDFKTIYVAATAEKRIRVYERHYENNSLTYIRSLYVPFLVDNIILNEHDQIIVAGHPNALLYVLHANNRLQHRAPSEVVIFLDPRSNSTFENLLLTNGELLSASTVGGTYKQKLLVGGFADPGILLCQDLM